MNKVHRLIWSAVRNAWIVAPENANSRGKPASSPKCLAATLVTALIAQAAYAAPPAPNALPTGGQVVAGQAAISQAGSAMTIQQGSDKAILNWNSFSIGSGASVNFQQPNASSVALNRVTGADPSAIYGSLTANGQVFLVNPNGVLFGAGARVDVGGLVASTLNIRNEDFLAGNHRFTRDGATAGVTNQGELLGKYVALLAPEVRNEGVIAASMGTAALAAGEAVTLGLTGNSLIDVQVEQAQIDTLVENKHLVKADGGNVVLSAQSAHTLLGQLVNSGAIEAQGISTDGGTIKFLASSNIDHSGSINADAGQNGKGGSVILMGDLTNPNSQTTVSGSISAKGGSQAGDGGFIETSGSHLSIADSAGIDTGAANGKSGTWLLDPVAITVANSGGTVSVTTLQNALASGNVILDTFDANSCVGVSCTTATGPGESITIVDNVTWNSLFSLQLASEGTININAVVHNTNTTSGGINFFTFMGDVVFGANGLVKISNSEQLQLINTATNNTNSKLVGNYELANNIDASTVPIQGALWNPIGPTGFEFIGTLDGKGFTVSGLHLDATPSGEAGLFGVIGVGGIVRNIGMIDPTDPFSPSASRIGALAGINAGTIENSYVRSSSKTISGGSGTQFAGGLVGENTGTIRNSYANIAVDVGVGSTATAQGGLVGSNSGTIENSYSMGAVSANAASNGGLVGTNTGTLTNSYYNSTTSGRNDANGTAKTTAQMTASTVLSDLGFDTAIWQRNAATGYPIFIYDTSGALTVVYVRLNTGSSIYGDTPTLNWGYYSDAAGNSAVTNLTPTGVNSVSWLYNGNPITLSTTNASATPYSLTYGSGLTLSGYSFSAGAATDWTVTPRTVILNASKTYDGTTNLTAAQITLGNLVPNQSLTLGGTAPASDASFATVNKYISSTVNLTLGDGANGLASNYQLPAAAYHANDNTVTINKANLVLSGTRQYDATTVIDTSAATATTLMATGVNNESFAVTGTSSVSGKDASATPYALIAVDGLTLGASNGMNTALASNYNALSATGSGFTISQRPITVDWSLSNGSKVSKEYDGNDQISLLDPANTKIYMMPAGFAGSELLLPVNASNQPGFWGTYDSKDAGARTVTVDLTGANWQGIGLGQNGFVVDPNQGNPANYTFPTGTLTTTQAEITRRQITAELVATVNGTPVPISKSYDGTNSATISVWNFNYNVANYVAGEGAFLAGTNSWQTGTFGTKDAGTGKLVTVNVAPADYVAIGATNLNNYIFVDKASGIENQVSGYVGAITPAPITVKAVDQSRPYGNNNPTSGAVTLTSGTVFGTDVLGTATLTSTATGTTAAGQTAPLTPSSQTFSTGNAGNYAVQYQDGVLSIDPRTVTLSASKTYDGTTTLTGTQVTIGNLTNGQVASYTGATASNAHVGGPDANKTTVDSFISAITLTNNGGFLASNYQLPSLTSATAGVNTVTISEKTLTPTISNTGVTKVYNSNTNAPTGFTPTYTFAGLVGGDTATLTHTSTAYNNKNVTSVSNASNITVSGLAISSITGSNGSAATDYVLDATSKNVTATITKANLSVTGLVASNKVYDATTNATLTGTPTIAPLGNDVVTVGGTAVGTFADKNVGTGIAITVTGNTITGTDAGNYNLVQQSGLMANISPSYSAAEIVVALLTGSDAGRNFWGAQNVEVYNSLLEYTDSRLGPNGVFRVNGVAAAGTELHSYALRTLLRYEGEVEDELWEDNGEDYAYMLRSFYGTLCRDCASLTAVQLKGLVGLYRAVGGK